ncbi:hypothetical protein GIS00_23300 [Nakamurella sp. YIM 132087]|uniref:VCBS repeat-containing protein n=1 Tax=Nakamurella alba TaxID=2665158 RepID=A0A7K1FRU5_9ACTN|nr:hypothetical protein [Nakamurella alba]MTD16865.1 hypothetical protein [Nakamurella alba]
MATAVMAAVLLPLVAAGPASAVPPYFSDIPTNNVSGTNYLPIVGDFGGNPTDDILWYAYKGGKSSLFRANGDGTFVTFPLSISGRNYAPLVGDFVGDARDEILWVTPGSSRATMWRFDQPGRVYLTAPIDVPVGISTFASLPSTTADVKSRSMFMGGGTTHPIRVDTYTWPQGGDLTRTGRSYSITGDVRPVVGDLDGNGLADILFYGAGTRTDAAWFTTGAGSGTGFRMQPERINGSYAVATGSFAGAADDVLFDGATDYLWTFDSAGAHASRPVDLGPIADKLILRGPRDVVLLWAPEDSLEVWQIASGTQSITVTGNLPLPATYRPIVGGFTGDGSASSVFWWGPGAAPERIYIPDECAGIAAADGPDAVLAC